MTDGVRLLLEDVAGEFPVTGEQLDRTIRRARRRQRRQRLVAGATAVVVAAAGIGATVWAFTGHQPARPAGLHANGAVVFVRFSERSIGGRGGDLYRVNPDGSGLLRLTRHGHVGVGISVSPDGSSIAFGQSPEAGPMSSAIFVVGLDGRGLRQLTHPEELSHAAPSPGLYFATDEWPSWSADGKSVRFYRNTGSAPGKGLWEVNADGSNEHLVAPGWIPWYPAWSPDRTRVAWVGDRGTGAGRGDLFVADPDGTRRVRLTSDPGLVEMAAWSPDGLRIAFVNGKAIETIAPDGTDRRSVFVCQAACKGVLWPTWSPDGTAIAFTEFVGGPEAHGSIPKPKASLVVMKADGSAIETVPLPFEACCPAWQPLALPSPAPTELLPTASLPVVPASCGGHWQAVPAISPGNFGADLAAVDALSPTDVWAVGRYSTGPPGYSPPPPSYDGPGWPTVSHPLAEHWDGHQWNVVSMPNPGALPGNSRGGAYLTDVSAVSPDDVWAVGGASGHDGGIMEHWDGERWTVVSSPQVNLVDGQLIAVSAISSDDVWAVGTQGGDRLRTLIEHWDGRAWTIVPSPNPGTRDDELTDVWARSSTDAWAVGSMWDRSLIEHWDGSRWSVVASPTVRSTRLKAVAGLGSDDVWAVGTSYADVDGNGPAYGVIEHWDGTSWTEGPEFPAGTEFGLSALAALRPDDVWAAGLTGGGSDTNVVLHWDGSRWASIDSPAFSIMPGYGDISAAGTNVWFVGGTPDQPGDRAVSATFCER